MMDAIVRLLPPAHEAMFVHDPMVGGGSVAFKLAWPYTVINDVNSVLISVYRQIQVAPMQVHFKVDQLREEFMKCETHNEKKLFYLAVRKKYNTPETTALERIPLFIFMNRTGYNGVYRVNKKGLYNVPFGRHKSYSFSDITKLVLMQNVMRGWIINNSNVFACKTCPKNGDFAFFDPPYPNGEFNSYDMDVFTLRQHQSLAAYVRSLASNGVRVMVTISDSALVRQMYSFMNFHETVVVRSVGQKVGSRGKVKELILTSYDVYAPETWGEWK